MKPVPNWGVIFRDAIAAVSKAVADFKANKPRPASPPMTSDQIQAAGKVLQARIAALDAFVTAHPGAIVALDDLLDFFEAQGDEWATEIEAGVNAAPGALATAGSWLPTLLGLYGAIQPAPIGIPGGFSGARGHIL